MHPGRSSHSRESANLSLKAPSPTKNKAGNARTRSSCEAVPTYCPLKSVSAIATSENVSG